MAFMAPVKPFCFSDYKACIFDSLRNGLILGIQLVPFLMYMICTHPNLKYQMMHVLTTHFVPLAAQGQHCFRHYSFINEDNYMYIFRYQFNDSLGEGKTECQTR